MRKINAIGIIELLVDGMLMSGNPAHIRFSNSLEIVGKFLRESLTTLGIKSLCIEPGSPFEKGYDDLFNAKLRDKLPSGEIFCKRPVLAALFGVWR